MRGLPGLLCAVSVACATEPVCDDATCASVCASTSASQQAAVPDGGTVLTAYEFERVQASLLDLRRGVQWLDNGSLGVCRGTVACDAFIDEAQLMGLAPGTYNLSAGLRVPTVGRFSVDFGVLCTDAAGDTIIERTRSIPLKPNAEGVASLPALLSFSSPPQGELAGATSCRFAFATGRDGGEFRHRVVGVTF